MQTSHLRLHLSMEMASLYHLLLLVALTVSPASARLLPTKLYNPGPIDTNGRNYTHVCHPGRFASLGLDVEEFSYCKKDLSYEDRVRDLVGRMTLAEKIGLLGDVSFGAPRVGLPPYKWWSEALHGVSWVGKNATYFGDIVPGATSFPQVILTAASFNESLWKSIGQVISTEARAMYNLGHAGLTFWSPNINVIRDPRWGRILETAGEDPLTVGLYAVNFVRGLQDVKGHETAEDPNSRPLKVSSCCKHFAAYDVDNWFGVDRYMFDARVSEQDLVETYNRPFETCVKDADVSSVMCSYNKVNGIPACADSRLLSQTIRGDWKLHGYIVADCDSIEVMQHGHHWLNDQPEDAVSQVMKAGLDLDCGVYYTNYTGSAVAQGKVRETDIDNALQNQYVVLMRLGFFDGIPAYQSLGKDDICSKDHKELAAEAAREGIVLLKNNNHTLPLNPKKHKKIALVGPHANTTWDMIGTYEGLCLLWKPSPLKCLDYKEGCNVSCKDQSLIFPAVKAARKADATIILAGLDRHVESEGLDRKDILLPGNQTNLINKVANAAKGPVVLVILSAGGVDISFAQNNPKIDAILWAGYPGGEGGHAVADVVFGRYNPGGRLPITWYHNEYVEELPITSMQLRPNPHLGYPGRTYKFFNGTTLYHFGHGLSYTQFSYKLKSSVSTISTKLGPHQQCKHLHYISGITRPPCPAIVVDESECKEDIDFEVEVANTGSRDGEEVVMVYSKASVDIVGAPIKQLVAFRRVFVKAGASKSVNFTLNACKALSIVDKSAYTVLPSGKHSIEVGHGGSAVSFDVHVNLQKN